MRGSIIPISAKQAVTRALLATLSPARYKLGAGGKDPSLPYPMSSLDGVFGSDCVGFVAWALGFDRFQEKEFSTFGGWINTDSILLDAAGNREFFEFTDKPRAGDLVVFPSLLKDGKRIRIGHVALVTETKTNTAAWTDNLWRREKSDRASYLEKIIVIDCSANILRKLAGYAIQQTTAAASWNKPDARFVRYTRQASES